MVSSPQPPSSPSSPRTILTKQLPARSPLPASPVRLLRRLLLILLCASVAQVCDAPAASVSLNSSDEGGGRGDWGRNMGEKHGWIKQTRGGGFTQLAPSCRLSRRSEKGYVYKQPGAQPPIFGERTALCHCRKKKQRASPALLDPIQLYVSPFSPMPPPSWLFSAVESTLSLQWPSTIRGLVNHFRSVSSLTLATRDGFYWGCIPHAELWSGQREPDNNLFGLEGPQ